jgi:electron transport complex protein RnfG
VTAAVALAAVNRLTKDRIAEQKRLKKIRLLKAVLPPIDNAIDQDTQEIVIGKDRKGRDLKLTFYIGKKEAQLVGAAFSLITSEGYSGDIEILMGVDPQGSVTGIEIISQKETPGLGDQILKPTWRDEFEGKSLASRLDVKKDGGEIDQFAGATISPRAVVKAVRRGLELYQKEFRYGTS